MDDDGWGIGVWFPGTVEMTAYRFEGPSGPQGSGCSYFAPIKQFAITPGLEYEYDVYLTIGRVDEIRATVYRLHRKELAARRAKGRKKLTVSDESTFKYA